MSNPSPDKPEPGESNQNASATSLAKIQYSLAAAALTLPTYWPQNPDAWFTKIEAQLRNAGITSELTRFNKVLAVLPESAAVRVREIAQKPNYETGDYDRLKEKLISSGQATTLERLDKLCNLRNVVHARPSEVLLDIENLFHSSVLTRVFPSNDYVKTFWWLRALPTQIQQNLLPIADTTPLNNLVVIADQMFASNPPVERVSEVHIPSSVVSPLIAPEGDQTSELDCAAIQNRTKKFARSPRKDLSLLCKYHIKFGDQAKRCVQGCARYESNQKN